MKKALMILALMATGMCARAQVDTLRIGDREPTYYYWDTNWWDHYFINYPGANQIYWYSVGALSHAYCKAEVARYCYSDQPLRVIGIAVAASIFFDYNLDDMFTDHGLGVNADISGKIESCALWG